MSIAEQGSSLRRPPTRALAHVIANQAEGNGRRMRLAVPGWTGSQPGQFLMLAAGVEGAAIRRDPLLPRPMAVFREISGEARALGRDARNLAGEACEIGDEGPEIEVLYRVVGRGTALLADARRGDRLPVVGPLGRGFEEVEAESSAPASGPVFLVGGGTGIASLYEWARRLARRDRKPIVLLGGRSRADLLGWSDFEALGIELVATTDDGSHGTRGLVTKPLGERLAATAGATVYAVGPTPMMRACAALAEEHEARCFVSLENPMACGFGVCLGCAAPRREGGFALVCRTGPVFDARAIAWPGLS